MKDKVESKQLVDACGVLIPKQMIHCAFRGKGGEAMIASRLWPDSIEDSNPTLLFKAWAE